MSEWSGKAGSGRKINPRRIDAIVKCRALGMPWSRIAEGIGIARQTLAEWRKWGREHIEQGAESDYAELVRRLEEVELEGEYHLVDAMTQAALGKAVTYERYEDGEVVERRYAKPDVSAGKFLLAVRDREAYSERSFSEVKVDGQVRHIPTLEGMTFEEVMAIKGEAPKQLVDAEYEEAGDGEEDE